MGAECLITRLPGALRTLLGGLLRVFPSTGDHAGEDKPRLCVRVPDQIPKGHLRCPSFPDSSWGAYQERGCHRGEGHLGQLCFWAPEEREVHKNLHSSCEALFKLSIQGPVLLAFWICFFKESEAWITGSFCCLSFSQGV